MINPAFTNGKEIRTGSFLRYRIDQPPAAPGTSGPALHRHNQDTDRPAGCEPRSQITKRRGAGDSGRSRARHSTRPATVSRRGPPEPPAAGPGHPHTGRFRDCRAGSGHVPCRCARRRSDACRPSGPAMPACRRRHRRVRVRAVTRAAPPHPGYGTSVSATGRNGGRLGAGALLRSGRTPGAVGEAVTRDSCTGQRARCAVRRLPGGAGDAVAARPHTGT